MSDNEQQPETPQLTRRQLRELRNTASNPIIVDPTATDEADAVAVDTTPDRPASDASAPDVPAPSGAAPLARAAEPVDVPPPPQASADLGAPALTRRQARLQEKIRTASIPVIGATGEQVVIPDEVPQTPASETDEVGLASDDATDAAGDVDSADDAQPGDAEEAPNDADLADEIDAADETDDVDAVVEELPTTAEAAADEAVAAAEDVIAEEAAVIDTVPSTGAEVFDDTDAENAHEPASDVSAGSEDDAEIGHESEVELEPEPEQDAERHVVSEDLGADLLAGQTAMPHVPASFDQLLSRSAAATGAFTAPNALILTQTPDGGPLVAPVTATGEVLITGTFSLPESYASTGVVPGSADGKDVDAVLVDNELPASSSPTPIAASAAISTIKSAEDVIRPPAPEKGGRWTVALAITAGALALALAGVLVVALVTGVFQ